MDIKTIETSIKSELEKIKEMDLSYNIIGHKMDYVLAKCMYKFPEENPEFYLKKIEEAFPDNKKKYNPRFHMKDFKLDHPRRREYWKNILKESSDLLHQLSFGENVNNDIYIKLKKNINYLRRPKIQDKAILAIFIDDLKNMNKLSQMIIEEFEEIITISNFSQCHIFLERLVNKIARLRDLNKDKRKLTIRKDLKQSPVVEQTYKMLDNTEIPDEAKSLIYELIEEYEDLRTTLVAINQDNEDLQKEISENEEKLSEEVVTNFFKELNSTKYNNFIDNLYKTNLIIKNDFDTKDSIGIIKKISTLLSIFIKVLKRNNILEIETVGDKKEINYQNIGNYDYIGSEYTGKDAVKFVEVIKPGWKYKNMIISKPQVREIGGKQDG